MPDADGDLLIQNGDFVVGPSDPQHIKDIINSFPGWWKRTPTVGVGIFQYLNSAGQEQTIEKSIKTQLQADGYVVASPEVSFDANGELTIAPNAVRV